MRWRVRQQAAIAELEAGIARERVEELERRLQQSQRLESIGQLAGGIAHDFNNLLSVILNYACFAIDELSDQASVREDVEQIKKAAERAADLTHRLLVFSRSEVVGLEAIDINQIVRDTEALLKRTIGEHILMESRLEPDLWPVELGSGQMEQVVVNLALNARDAMPGGGRLEIRTENVELDGEAAHDEWAVPAGGYARLTVMDTGCGMEKEIAARAFDPFFTTKPTGSNTGLGLATVYGIAKQAGGYAQIHSEPGHGTTVKVYLPLSEQLSTVQASHLTENPLLRGSGERILLVEDDAAVRALAKRILTSHGYEVIDAEDGASGLRACCEQDRPVDLLLTDVVMPQLSGTQLAEQVRAITPGTRALYMSGYASGVVSMEGGIDEGVALLEKPFSADSLLRKVRTVLDEGKAGSNGAGVHGKVHAAL
jgi:nitrogen-specific signal transduction histidine kinase/CheY-like chemotaxis protein